MDKTKAQKKEAVQFKDERTTHTPIVGKKMRLPGGIVYYHDLHKIEPATEGTNLLDLQTRQDAVPLFSNRAKMMMGAFSSGRSDSSVDD